MVALTPPDIVCVIFTSRFASEVVITGGAFAYGTMMYGKVRWQLD